MESRPQNFSKGVCPPKYAKSYQKPNSNTEPVSKNTFSNFFLTALKLSDWSRDNYFLKQHEVMGQTLQKADQTYWNGGPRTGVKFPDFVDGIERV